MLRRRKLQQLQDSDSLPHSCILGILQTAVMAGSRCVETTPNRHLLATQLVNGSRDVLCEIKVCEASCTIPHAVQCCQLYV